MLEGLVYLGCFVVYNFALGCLFVSVWNDITEVKREVKLLKERA